MKVTVLFFGALKDLLKGSRLDLEFAEGAAVSDVFQRCLSIAPEIEQFKGSLAISINREYAGLRTAIHDGDEIGFLPPVSGGTESRAQLVRHPIDTAAVVSEMKKPEDGACVVFEGVVRNHTRDRNTLYLEYEAYEEMAVQQMNQLTSQALSGHKIRDAAIVHRFGRLEIGEISVLIVVCSAHRAPAFDACRWLIDSLKRSVPIWKKEWFEDGSVWADGEPFPTDIAVITGSRGEGPASK